MRAKPTGPSIQVALFWTAAAAELTAGVDGSTLLLSVCPGRGGDADSSLEL